MLQVKLADFGISILSAQGSSGLRPYSGSVSDSANLPPLDADSSARTDDDYAEFHISEELAAPARRDLDSTSGFAATQSIDPDAAHAPHVFEATGAPSVDSSAETNRGPGPQNPSADPHLTATGVLVGTPQAFLFDRRCMVLRQRRLGIRKRGRQVGSGRERKRAVWCDRTFTPHRNGSQLGGPFSLGWAPLTHESRQRQS